MSCGRSLAEEDSQRTNVYNQREHLSKVLVEAPIGSQAIMHQRREVSHGSCGIGLDAMAAAASLRCVRLTPTASPLRSSFADLLDAAASR